MSFAFVTEMIREGGLNTATSTATVRTERRRVYGKGWSSEMSSFHIFGMTSADDRCNTRLPMMNVYTLYAPPFPRSSFFSLYACLNISPNNGYYRYSQISHCVACLLSYHNRDIKSQIVLRKAHRSFAIIKVYELVCKSPRGECRNAIDMSDLRRRGCDLWANGNYTTDRIITRRKHEESSL
jgi:hypothetical protein